MLREHVDAGECLGDAASVVGLDVGTVEACGTLRPSGGDGNGCTIDAATSAEEIWSTTMCATFGSIYA